MSLKTVETHLAHTYAKLGLAGAGSRRRLAGLLDDGQSPGIDPFPRQGVESA